MGLTIFGFFLSGPRPAFAQSFANGVAQGTVTTTEIWEASGLVASRQNPGVVWVHNDSGFAGNVFALSTNGTLLARYYLPSVFFGNFEDIAIGPGPSPEAQYIYLGDIGDNSASRSSIFVYRFPEPAVYSYQTNNPRVDVLPGAQTIELVYPDEPHDAEALLVDPITGDLFIATKHDDHSRIYRASRAQLDASGIVTMTFIRQIGFQKVAGGDISSDGRIVALRRENKAARWNRNISTQTVGDALGGSNTEIPVIGESNGEPNGEALGFHPTGLGYYTISEGSEQPIYFFRRTDAGVPRQPVVFIGAGEAWRFRDRGTDEGVAWRQPGYSDTNWSSGPAQLGFGQGDEQTLISAGVDEFERNTTTYFRKQFTRSAGVALTNLSLRICFSDGAAVYLNGTEVFRRNLASAARFDEFATASHFERQNFWVSVPVNPALVVTGVNTIAVELHRVDVWESYLSFDFQLSDAFVELPARFTTEPQLVAGAWRINIAGPAGSLVRVEASHNLSDWIEVGQVTLTGGVGQFQESASSENCRFYRLKN